jgi:hypothetical protein
MRKLNIDNPAKLFAQLSAITGACDPNDYAPLEYDIDGIYLRLVDGSPPTDDYLLAIHAVANRLDIARHHEGEGANYRRYRLVYLAPLETYFWGEYRWRDPEGLTVRVRWHRIPKTYNAQLDALRKSRQGGRGDA